MSYQFTELTNHGTFWKFSKALIRDRVWAGLPHSTHAVLPVLGIHADQHGVAFPGEERIAALCGSTAKTVRSGVSALYDLSDYLRIEPYTTARGRRSKRFKFLRIPSDGKEYFAFHRIIVDGGNWAEVLPVGKALYPVMRHFGFYTREDIEDGLDELTDDAFKLAYGQRAFDICEADFSVMADLAGLSRRSVAAAVASLQSCHLLERHEGAWKVYRIPPKYFRRDWLNKKLQSPAKE